jgi:hypothetical protein
MDGPSREEATADDNVVGTTSNPKRGWGYKNYRAVPRRAQSMWHSGRKSQSGTCLAVSNGLCSGPVNHNKQHGGSR